MKNKYCRIIKYILILILLSSCAPMPGPTSGSNFRGMSEDEIITFLDANRGPAPMLPGFTECGAPFSLREMKDSGRLLITKMGIGDTINYCTEKVLGIENPVAKALVWTLVQPMGCANFVMMYDPWLPGDHSCDLYFWLVHPGDENNHVLAHELRHAQGYDDILY